MVNFEKSIQTIQNNVKFVEPNWEMSQPLE